MTLALKRTKKQPPHTKKRTAQHHRKSKSYDKAYWPYLTMFLILILGFYANHILSSHGAVLGANSNFTGTMLLSDTNHQRAVYSLEPLSLNAQLSQAAQTKADDMVSQNYWSHDTPQGQTPWSFITKTGYQYQDAGENLAYGFATASSTLTAWMNSPEHRANILDSNYQNVGFGVASSVNYQGKGPQTVVVAMYAEPISAVSHITFTVAPSSSDQTISSNVIDQDQSQTLVARINQLSGSDSIWIVEVISFISGAAITIFVVRHAVMLRRIGRRGETFLLKHPTIDICIVLIATIGIIATRTSGAIR